MRLAADVLLCSRLRQFYNLLQVAMDKRSALARCVAEALRLRAPGVDVRAAARDLWLPAGDGKRVRVRQARRLGLGDLNC